MTSKFKVALAGVERRRSGRREVWNNNLNEALCFSNVSLCTQLQSQENEMKIQLGKMDLGQFIK